MSTSSSSAAVAVFSQSRIRRVIVAIVVACSLLFAGVVAAERSYADTAPSQLHADAIRNQVFNLLNAERASQGRAPLRLNSKLMASARSHNIRMAAYNLMSHLLPGELSLGGRILHFGYLPWLRVGENIAFNTDWSLSGAYYVQKLMFNEVAPNDGHRVNILNTGYSDVGIDVYIDATHHKMWITEDFGHLQ